MHSDTDVLIIITQNKEHVVLRIQKQFNLESNQSTENVIVLIVEQFTHVVTDIITCMYDR